MAAWNRHHQVVRPEPADELAGLLRAHDDFVRSLCLGTSIQSLPDGSAALRARLRGAAPDELRAAGAAAARHVPVTRVWDDVADEVIKVVARKRLPWTVEDAEWLLGRSVARCDASERAMPGAGMYHDEYFHLALAAGSPFAGHQGFLPDVAHLVARIGDSCYLTYAAKHKMIHRLLALVESRVDDTVPTGLRHDGDGFAGAARQLLARQAPEATTRVAELFNAFGSGVRPSATWRSSARAVVAESPQSLDLARELVVLAVETPALRPAHGVHLLLAEGSLGVVRAAMWLLAGSVPDADTVRIIEEAALRGGIGVGGSGGVCVCQGLATSAVAALAAMAGSEPVAVVSSLERIRDRVANKTIRKGVDAALADVALASGMTRGQLVERSVPTLGLDADGRASRSIGDHVALLCLTGDATPRLEIRWRGGSDRTTASAPAAVRASHPDDVAALRRTAAEAKKLVAQQRRRLESLLAESRSWTAAEWAEHYVDHPVVGWTARRLIWMSATGETTASGLPRREGERWLLDGHDGARHEVHASHRLSLWHPLLATPDEVRLWREHLLDTKTAQPFRQAFREVYRLTPAEAATGTYSNRFAGHLLRYPQAGALMRARDWSARHLGSWDGGFAGDAVKTVGDTGWRAHFLHDLVEETGDPYAIAAVCSSDQVRFERRQGDGGRAQWVEQRLHDVPPLVLSEVMRDVDLFVGVTSIATDPTWADRGSARLRDYWTTESVGPLGASAEIRKEALERLIPRTRLAGRARVDGRFLVVDGSRRTYKIHLGSGNVLMSPDDTYLCIVADRTGRGGKVFLPFEEGDGMLATILSKAFLLADDSTITDETILSQLR